MASQKTLEMKRDQTLRRLINVKVVSGGDKKPNHDERRSAIKRWCKAFYVPYSVAMEEIKKRGPALLAKEAEEESKSE